MFILHAGLSASVLVSCGALAEPPVSGAQQPDARYEIRYNNAPDADRLEVTIDITGLDATSKDVALYIEEWGQWLSFDSLYLRCVRSSPPAHRDPAAGPVLKIDVPEGWDGSIHAEYQIPLIEMDSRLHETQGLLPWRSAGEAGRPGYVHAFANNTLPRVMVNSTIVNIKPVVTLRAPLGMSIATGWAGVSEGEQTVTLESNIDKTPILFGVPLARAGGDEGATRFEVVQFSCTQDITPDVLAIVKSLAPCYAAMTGHPAKAVERVFIVDGGGGQQTDHGLLIGLSSVGEGSISSPYFKQLVAHELFHEWLGGAAHGGGESMVWFKEGFTDYLSIRGCAMTGVVSWDWFASRLLELDGAARTGAACGRVAFGDEGVNWRDGDGPNESLAYKGGAVLAFCADVELISRGQPGLAAMIGDFAAHNGGEYNASSIKDWLTSHGLGEFHATYIAKPGLPDAAEALERAGFDESGKRRVKLAYLGMATEGGAVFGTVTAVDPQGPAAAAGIRVGDVVNGLYPVLPEGERPRVGPDVHTEFTFGLALCNPDAPSITVGLERDGLQVPVKPRVIEGGERLGFLPGPGTAKFFGEPSPK